MSTFLEQKMAALEAVQRRKKRTRLMAIAAIALFTTAVTTGYLWLAALGVILLIAAALTGRASGRPARETPETPGGEERLAEAVADAPSHAVPEPAGPCREAPIECTLELSEPVTLATADGDGPTLAAGSHEASFRLTHPPERPSADDAVDYPRCESWIRDDKGQEWRGTSFLDPNALTRPLELADRPIHFWEGAPAAWRAVFEKDCALTGVRQLMDSRDRIELPVGDRVVTMMFKYQGPEIDVGWLADEKRLVVRAARMYYEVWKDGEYDDIVDQVTFTYLLAPEDLLPLAAPEHHWTEWEQWDEHTGDTHPELVFEKTADS